MINIKKIIDGLDAEDLCRYCVHHDYCEGSVKCYGGEPIYPPCADGLSENDFDMECYLQDMEESDET